jgi:hypothetical protein
LIAPFIRQESAGLLGNYILASGDLKTKNLQPKVMEYNEFYKRGKSGWGMEEYELWLVDGSQL